MNETVKVVDDLTDVIFKVAGATNLCSISHFVNTYNNIKCLYIVRMKSKNAYLVGKLKKGTWQTGINSYNV